MANGGSGNEWISNSIIQEVENSEYKNILVVVGWTEITRLLGTFDYNIVTIRPQDFDGLEGKEEWNTMSEYHRYVLKHQKVLRKFFNDIVYCIYKTYLSIHKLKTYLENKQIPYIFFDSINPSKVTIKSTKYYGQIILHSSHKGGDINLKLKEDEYSSVINDKWNDYLFDEKWIELDGTRTVIELINRNSKLYEGEDSHPNEKLSFDLSEIIYKKYRELY